MNFANQSVITSGCIGDPFHTQLTDVEQEENGLYTYDRKLKFNKDRLYAAMAHIAAIED